MPNKVAFYMAAVIIVAIALDLIFGWGGTAFTARKFLEFIEWLEFWR
ncbi:hypothetical protein [Falsirhodobacter sp. alg1]|nr:hypothetical protein [Falsirhodobacter sp. alg1]